MLPVSRRYPTAFWANAALEKMIIFALSWDKRDSQGKRFMVERLLEIDQELFLKLNGLYTSLSDTLMVFASSKRAWIPFYVLLVLWMWWRKGWRFAVWLLLGAGLCVLLSDRISVLAFKDTVQRLRPCRYLPTLGLPVHIPEGEGCWGAYGFVSSHAANVFSVAVFLSLLARRGWMTVVMLVWASWVSVSRVFVGVHYPGDVLCGAMLGVLVGILVYFVVRWVSLRCGYRWWVRKGRR